MNNKITSKQISLEYKDVSEIIAGVEKRLSRAMTINSVSIIVMFTVIYAVIGGI